MKLSAAACGAGRHSRPRPAPRTWRRRRRWTTWSRRPRRARLCGRAWITRCAVASARPSRPLASVGRLASSASERAPHRESPHLPRPPPAPAQFLYTRSQADLLSATSLNPTPTTGASTIPRTSAPTPSSDRSIHRSIRFVPSGQTTVRRPNPRLSASDLPPVSFRAPAQSLLPSPRSPGTSASATCSSSSASRWSASAPSRSA